MKHSLAGVELKSLLVLVQLMESGSVVETAKQLVMQQSTVTYHLNKLRSHFNDPLFIPSGRGLEPTKKALELMHPLRTVIMELEQVVLSKPLDLSVAEGRFRIAMQDLAAFMVIPKLVNHLQQVAPGVVIDASLWSENTELELLNGDLDIVFNTVNHQSPHFYGTEVGQLPMCAIYSSTHPLAKREWTVSDVFDYPHVNILPYTDNQKLIDKLANSLGKVRNHIATSTSYHLLTQLLQNSDRISIVSSGVATALTHDSGIKASAIEELNPVSLYCYWHQRNDNDALHKFVRSTLVDLCKAEMNKHHSSFKQPI